MDNEGGGLEKNHRNVCNQVQLMDPFSPIWYSFVMLELILTICYVLCEVTECMHKAGQVSVCTNNKALLKI